VAVTSSYPQEALADAADLVIDSLAALDIGVLTRMI
jgi:hypothetical protein